MEEYHSIQTDALERFQASASVAFAHNWLQVPICDIWSEALIHFLEHTLNHELQAQQPRFHFQPTFDIDNTFAYAHKNTIRTFLNGKPVASLVDDLTPAGFIALQVHSIGKAEEAGKKIRWRNINIQTANLQPTPLDPTFVVNLIPNHVSEQEKMQGVHLLFDGKTTNGWRGAYKAGFPDKGWKAQDGILTVQPSNGAESTNGGDIISENEYGAFIFQFDFKSDVTMTLFGRREW